MLFDKQQLIDGLTEVGAAAVQVGKIIELAVTRLSSIESQPTLPNVMAGLEVG